MQGWQALSSTQRPSNPWAASLDQWSRLFSPPTPPYADVFARLLAQSKSFMGFGEAMGDAFGSSTDPAEVQELFMRSLKKLREGLDTDLWHGSEATAVSGLWQLPLQSWQRAASTVTGLPIDILHQAHDDSPAMTWLQKQLEVALGIPGLGYTREFQEQYRELARLTIDYQKAFKEYAVAYGEVGKRTVEEFNCRLRTKEDSGAGAITSVRDLFNLWIDSGEKEYAEFVTSDDYVRLHGRMTNALMRLKRQQQAILDDRLEAMNAATRRELDTLSRRFHEMRRSRLALQVELKAIRARQDDMQRQLASLRQHFKPGKKRKIK